MVTHVNELQPKFGGSLRAFVVAGDLNTNPDEVTFVSERTLEIFDSAQFLNPVLAMEKRLRVTRPGKGWYPDATFDYVLAKALKPVGPPEILKSDLSDHYPVTIELQLPE